MSAIGRKAVPVTVIVHYPETDEGKDELAVRIADIHAAAVNYRIKSLNCPTYQKLELLNAVIQTVQERIQSGQNNSS